MTDPFKRAYWPLADILRRSVCAGLRGFVKGILPECKYGPDPQDAAVDLLQRQALRPALEMV